jgi:hypothetical protein
MKNFFYIIFPSVAATAQQQSVAYSISQPPLRNNIHNNHY